MLGMRDLFLVLLELKQKEVPSAGSYFLIAYTDMLHKKNYVSSKICCYHPVRQNFIHKRTVTVESS